MKGFSRFCVSRHADRERGFALLIVLWTLVLISLIVTAVIATGRSSARLDTASTAIAVAEAQADAAIQTAAYHFVATDAQHWAADGRWHALQEPDLVASVRVTLERDWLNPNLAPPQLMAAVLEVLGQPEDAAKSLAHLILLWRTPPQLMQQANRGDTKLPPMKAGCQPLGRPFQTVDDMAGIPGMTPQLLAALTPHLSFTQSMAASPLTRDRMLRAAFVRLAATQPGAVAAAASTSTHASDSVSADGDMNATSVMVEARVGALPGRHITRRAIIMIDPSRSPPNYTQSVETTAMTEQNGP